MMKWYNLWGGDWFSYAHYSTQEYEDYIDWIKQVKAEGDRLRDRATKVIDKLQLNQCRPCKYWHEMVENEAGEWAPFCDLFHGNGIQIPCDQRVIRQDEGENMTEPLRVVSVKMLTPPNSYTFVWNCPCGDRNGATIELGQLVTEATCMTCGAICEIQVEWNKND